MKNNQYHQDNLQENNHFEQEIDFLVKVNAPVTFILDSPNLSALSGITGAVMLKRTRIIKPHENKEVICFT